MNTKELFQALEFAHYAERFRGKVFVVALPHNVPFQELLLDIKVLTGYHIKLVLVTPDPDFRLDRVVATANKRGTRFHLSMVTDALYDPGEDRLTMDFGRIQDVLDRDRTPIIAYHASAPESVDVEGAYALAAQVALRLGADKLFLVGQGADELEALLARTHVTAEDLAALLPAAGRRHLEAFTPILTFIAGLLERGIPDIVLLEGRATLLFSEVFTHDGAGILFNTVRRARIRRARVQDVTDIALLLRPEVESGRLLPTDESVIERHIDSYWIYEVDGLLVGAARLKHYGPWAEMAQFTTLPRFRGRGRAKELAWRLVEQARAEGCAAVFALSIDPRMWEFFGALGFREVAREHLPEPWQRQYDWERPSRAFLKELA